MKRLLLSLVVVLIVGALFGGPFGIDMGMSLKDLEEAGMSPGESNDDYHIVTPPTPHPEFDIYGVAVDQEHGVYHIYAFGRTIKDNGFGVSTQEAFHSIKEAIDRSYGEGDIVDFLMYGSIWKEPRDWMKSLQQKERFLISFWKSQPDQTFKGNIEKIHLDASASSINSGSLMLNYYHPVYEEILNRQREALASVF